MRPSIGIHLIAHLHEFGFVEHLEGLWVDMVHLFIEMSELEDRHNWPL